MYAQCKSPLYSALMINIFLDLDRHHSSPRLTHCVPNQLVVSLPAFYFFKKNLFRWSGQVSKNGATGDFFFFIFCNFFFLQKWTIFSYQTTFLSKKTKLRPSNWPQLRPPAGQETDFFLWTALYHCSLCLFHKYFTSELMNIVKLFPYRSNKLCVRQRNTFFCTIL